MPLIHASYYRPRVFPVNGDCDPAEIDRVQDLAVSDSLNRTKIKEVGTDGTIDWKKDIPTISVTMRQLEYCNFEFWRKLTNKPDATTSIDLNDFKTALIDIACYKTDDDATFIGTAWYPKLRTSSFSINISDPDALIERNFTLNGEDDILWSNNNAYVIYGDKTCASGETGTVDIVIGSGDYATYPAPVFDPDESATFIMRVVRVRGGVSTELVAGTDYTYTSGTTTLAVDDCLVGDIIKFWYTATTYISGAQPFVTNTADIGGAVATYCTLLLNVNNTLYKMQSCTIDVSFDRNDRKEIGNTEVVSRGIRSKTVRVTLGRDVDGHTLEEILRGVSTTYGKIDAREFADNITFTVKIYTDDTKATFALGYQATNLSPVSLDDSAPVDNYTSRNVTLEGEELELVSLESDL